MNLSNYPDGMSNEDLGYFDSPEIFLCTECGSEMTEEGELCMSCWMEADDDAA